MCYKEIHIFNNLQKKKKKKGIINMPICIFINFVIFYACFLINNYVLSLIFPANVYYIEEEISFLKKL
jgi:hypothetical protein